VRDYRNDKSAGNFWTMRGGPRCVIAAGGVLAATACLFARTAGEPPTVAAAGSEAAVWLILTSRQQAGRENRPGLSAPLNLFAWLAPGAKAFEPVRIPPEVGHIVHRAAAGRSLFVFFDDGTFHSYSRIGRHIEVALPGRALPEAIAGIHGEDQPGLYAIVRRRVGRQILRQAEETPLATQRSTQPSLSAPHGGEADVGGEPLIELEGPTGARSEGTVHLAGRFDLVAYRAGKWRYVAPLGYELPAGRPHAWCMTASGRLVQVFTVPSEGARHLDYIRWFEGAWSQPRTLEVGGAIAHLVAGYTGSTPSLIVAAREAGGTREAASRLTWRIWREEGDVWQGSEPLAFASPEPGPAPDGAGAAATGFCDGALLARVGAGGSVEYSVFPPKGGPPTVPWTPVRAFDRPSEPLLNPRLSEWARMAVFLAVMLLIFWRRQESLAMPARLPDGFELARYWKRAAAALVDLVPALAATAWIWLRPALEYRAEIDAAVVWKDGALPSAPRNLLLGWFAARLVYALYNGVFEYLWGTTPGKRLFGCRVVSEIPGRLTIGQVIIRNVVRVLELEPYLRIWPLLLIVFLTRNRQRLGDLSARTVVVEPTARSQRRPSSTS